MFAYSRTAKNTANARNSMPQRHGPGPFIPFSHDNFPLMDLPPELRCMIYKQVDFVTKCHTLTRDEANIHPASWPPNPTGGSSAIELIRPSLPVALLRTSRLVNAEATSTFRKKIVELKNMPLQFQVDYAALIGLTTKFGPLAGCFTKLYPYVILSSTGNRAFDDFTNRCGPFINRKPAQHDPATEAPISVCITITQPHANVPRHHITTAAFKGVRDLRKFSQKFVCDVLYNQEHSFSLTADGSYPSWPTVRIKGLLSYMFDRRLAELEAMRQKARSAEVTMDYIAPFHRYGEGKVDEEMQRKQQAERDRLQRIFVENWMRIERERVMANVIERNKRGE
ncbi:hypothetical protein HBI70_117740 [Parastagonospora nodorum]|nr:hypothetical protein HBI10_104370 [Parastagonospora nodorum]KAH4026356.1 hypothetical protein HBI13_061250 [Parastagonospora nodorum]KAH4224136.1 hypothetical protein HBI06_130250 [Parastagonospora nodorum]KAH4241226.1 hypothetical protein HBI05_093770 [Parastagonospora nodorum]KAH5028246.1 hypothetical protein HBI74_118430 [Parastagonospora nodorum]